MKPRREPGEPRVEGDDEVDRYRAEAVEVGPVLQMVALSRVGRGERLGGHVTHRTSERGCLGSSRRSRVCSATEQPIQRESAPAGSRRRLGMLAAGEVGAARALILTHEARLEDAEPVGLGEGSFVQPRSEGRSSRRGRVRRRIAEGEELVAGPNVRRDPVEVHDDASVEEVEPPAVSTRSMPKFVARTHCVTTKASRAPKAKRCSHPAGRSAGPGRGSRARDPRRRRRCRPVTEGSGS